jgi:hypothetical protein
MALGQLPAEVDNYERRAFSAGVPYLPAVILGSMGRVLGSLEWAFIAADVLFPAFAFGLLYAASKELVESTTSRLLLAWSALLIPWGPRNFLWYGYDSFLAAPDFSRTPQPEISFTLVLLAVVLSGRALASKKLGTTIVVGVISSLIVYSYYFYAIAYSIMIGLLFISALFWCNWDVAQRAAVVLGIVALGSLPYILVIARGKAEGGQTDLLARVGTYTHTPRVIPLLCLVLGLLLFWSFGKRLLAQQEHQTRVGIFVLLLLSGLAGLNFQILSGYDAQHGHFWNRLILPVAFFLCGCSLLMVAERRWNRQRLLKILVVGTLILVAFNAGIRQLFVGVHISEPQRASRPEIELLKWAQSNVPTGSVIGTVDPNLILLIPAISANFTYVPSGLRSLTPTAEIVKRYYELASLLDLSPQEVESLALTPSHDSKDAQLFLVLRAGDIKSVTSSTISQNTKSDLSWARYVYAPRTFAEGYSRFLQTPNTRGHRLDYLVSRSDTSIPLSIKAEFIHAKVVHANERYQLIDLR